MGIGFWKEDERLCYRAPKAATIEALGNSIALHEATLLKMAPPRSQHTECLVPLSYSPNSQMNLVCVHVGHGGVFDYSHVAAEMPAHFAVYGVHALQFLMSRDEWVTVELMADTYAAALIARHLPDKPLVLYGAWAGGLIALEMAHRLAAAGKTPALVVLGDTRDPVEWLQRLRSRGTTERSLEQLLWSGFLEVYMPPELHVVPQIFNASEDTFWSLDEDARCRWIIDRMRSLAAPVYLLPLDAATLKRHFRAYRESSHAHMRSINRDPTMGDAYISERVDPAIRPRGKFSISYPARRESLMWN